MFDSNLHSLNKSTYKRSELPFLLHELYPKSFKINNFRNFIGTSIEWEFKGDIIIKPLPPSNNIVFSVKHNEMAFMGYSGISSNKILTRDIITVYMHVKYLDRLIA